MKKIVLIIVIAAVSLGIILSVFVFDPFKLNINFFGNALSIEKTANVITEIKKISEFTTACFYEDKIVQESKYEFVERKVSDKGLKEKNVNAVKESARSSWRKLKDAASSAIDNVKQSSDSSAKGVASAVGGAAVDIAVATGTSVKDVAVSSAPAIKDLMTSDKVQIDTVEIGKIVYTVSTKVRAGYDLSKIEKEHMTLSGDTLKLRLPPVKIFDIIANPSDWKLIHSEGNWEDAEIRAVQSKAKEAISEDAIAMGLLEKAESVGMEEIVSLFKSFGFKEVILL